MRTGEGVLNQRLRALRLSNASLKLLKLGFDKVGPWTTPPASSRHQRTDLSKCEPSVLAEPDQRHALSARRTILSSSSGPSGR